MKRLFIAIKIEESKFLLEVFEKIKRELAGEKIKWVEPGNLHLTLAFLGDTDNNLISQIKSAIDVVADSFKQFNIVINSAGVFKSIQNPTVIWLGIEQNNILSEIKKEFDLKLKRLGFTFESLEFKAHLTIGRPKNIFDKNKLKSTVEEFSNKVILNQQVEKITLYESILTSASPIYKAIHHGILIK